MPRSSVSVPPDRREQRVDGADLSAFLLAHAGFRVELGRIADVLDRPRDAAHAALVESQLDLVLTVLHHHHTDEDTWIWPELRRRAPEAAAALDALEEQHDRIDPLVAVASDRGAPLGERVLALRSLQQALRRHLDDEERDAVPLVERCFTAEEWVQHGRDVVGGYERSTVPLLFGWVCAAGSPDLVARALSEFPLPVRLVFRFVWWPAYRRRHERLYGTRLRRRADRA